MGPRDQKRQRLLSADSQTKVLSFFLFSAFSFFSTSAQADIGPKAVTFGAGPISVNTYTDNYVPTTITTAATTASLDVSLVGKWSIGLSTFMTTNETLVGYSVGGKLALGSRKTEESGGTDGIIQYTTTHVPRWHFDLFVGLARYRFSQNLSSSGSGVIKQLRLKAVKADLYGFNFAPSVVYALTERWGIQGQYNYNYGLATGFNVVAHGLLFGVNYAF